MAVCRGDNYEVAIDGERCHGLLFLQIFMWQISNFTVRA